MSFPDVMLIAGHGEGSRADGAKVIRGCLADLGAVDEAVAGYAFAERFGLSPGDTVPITSRRWRR